MITTKRCMVDEVVQNSQSLYSFTFTAVIVIHEYIYSHSTTKFTFKKYNLMMRKGSAQKMLNEYCTVLNEYLDCKCEWI